MAGGLRIEHHIHLTDGTREFLTHLVRPLLRGLNRLEHQMTTINAALDALAAKEDANSAALTDLVADVRALIAILSSPTDDSELSAEAQAKVDALAAKFDADAATISGLDAEVGDADGSDAAAGGDTGDGSTPAGDGTTEG